MTETANDLLDELQMELNELIAYIEDARDGTADGPQGLVFRRLDARARELCKRAGEISGTPVRVQAHAERIQRQIESIYREAEQHGA